MSALMHLLSLGHLEGQYQSGVEAAHQHLRQGLDMGLVARQEVEVAVRLVRVFLAEIIS